MIDMPCIPISLPLLIPTFPPPGAPAAAVTHASTPAHVTVSHIVTAAFIQTWSMMFALQTGVSLSPTFVTVDSV
jgi:hypothetical protein